MACSRHVESYCCTQSTTFSPYLHEHTIKIRTVQQVFTFCFLSPSLFLIMSTYTSKTTGDEVAHDCKDQIANKTVLVTGTTPNGLGATFATTIAPFGPALIILASHSFAKAEQTAKDIAAVAPNVKTRVVELDLSSISQVRKAAKEILSITEKIDVIVNNAGVMASPYSTTVDGIESQFGTNHIGHFLLTNLLLSSALGGVEKQSWRVVNVSSNGFRYGPVRIEDINFGVS